MSRIDENLYAFLELQKREINHLVRSVEIREKQIDSEIQRNAFDVIKIGLRLIEVRNRISRSFMRWCKENVEISYQKIWTYMRIAKKFDTLEIDPEILGQMQIKVLEILTQHTTPPELLNQVVELTKQGDRPNVRQVIEMKKGKIFSSSLKEETKEYRKYSKLPTSIAEKLRHILNEFPAEVVSHRLDLLKEELRKEQEAIAAQTNQAFYG
jgi:hypothetical protein